MSDWANSAEGAVLSGKELNTFSNEVAKGLQAGGRMAPKSKRLLDKRNMVELHARAAELKIKGRSKLNKDALIKAIRLANQK